MPRLPPVTMRNRSVSTDVRSLVRVMWNSIHWGDDTLRPPTRASMPAPPATSAGVMPSKSTWLRNPRVRMRSSRWCQRAWASMWSGSGTMSQSRNTRIDPVAAAAPVLRARARPKPARSWATTRASNGAPGGTVIGGSDPSSATTTSSRSIG